MQQSLTALKFVLEHAPIEQCVTIQASLTDPLVDVVRSLGDVEVIDISGGARPHTIVDRMRDAIRRRARAIVVYEDEVNLDTTVHYTVFCAIVDREVKGESVDGLRMVIVNPRLHTAYDPAFLDKTILVKEEA
jgi:hypothetical protein